MDPDPPSADEKPPGGEKVALLVRAESGREVRVALPAGMTLWRLRGELQARGVLPFPDMRHKMVLARAKGRPELLQPSTATLADAGIGPDDVLLILLKRPANPVVPPVITPAAGREAMDAVIEAECARRRAAGLPLPDRERERERERERDGGDFAGQLELAALLRSNPAFEARLRQPAEPSPALLQQVMAMGFPEDRARHALSLHRNRLEVALDWLLAHADEAEEAGSSGEGGASVHEAVPGGASGVNSPASETAALWEAANSAIRRGLNNSVVRQAIAEVADNPQAIHRYRDNPEVGPILESLMRAVGRPF